MELAPVLKQISEVEKVEFWLSGTMALANNNISGAPFSIIAFDNNTQLIEFNFIAGKEPENWDNTIVVNPEFIEQHPYVSVGDSLQFFTDGKIHTWRIAGIVKEIGSAKEILFSVLV